MNDERQEFSQRLIEAMRTRGYAPKPGVLLKLFNSRYEGRSVAFSTASKWLRGMALPEQDKLQVLASLFGIEPHILRYGAPASTRPGRGLSATAAWPAPLDPADRATIDTYLALPEPLRQHVRAVIAAMHK